MNPSQQGIISETAVLNRLVQLGYEVLHPWNPSIGYDLAICIGSEGHNSKFHGTYEEGKLLRLQVKTAWLSKDGECLQFNTSSVINGKRISAAYVGRAEYFTVLARIQGKFILST
jgi:hypothetical protein